ncbi:hypothetical protein NDA14_001934 [Ustilago hordei]|nr:hypothetical protein NDA15_005363 [Ustilago hordei]KAJ1604124.1 hypothetical protein NDA14_001934 [Ustilago hordei]
MPPSTSQLDHTFEEHFQQLAIALTPPTTTTESEAQQHQQAEAEATEAANLTRQRVFQCHGFPTEPSDEPLTMNEQRTSETSMPLMTCCPMIKPDDIGTYDGNTKNLEFFLGCVKSLIESQQDLTWESVIIKTFLLCLRETASCWYKVLGSHQCTELNTGWTIWETSLCNVFQPDVSEIRCLAGECKWEWTKESIASYFYTKLSLLHAAFPTHQETDLLNEIQYSLPASLQLDVQTHLLAKPNMDDLLTKLHILKGPWKATLCSGGYYNFHNDLLPQPLTLSLMFSTPTIPTSNIMTSSCDEASVPCLDSQASTKFGLATNYSLANISYVTKDGQSLQILCTDVESVYAPDDYISSSNILEAMTISQDSATNASMHESEKLEQPKSNVQHTSIKESIHHDSATLGLTDIVFLLNPEICSKSIPLLQCRKNPLSATIDLPPAHATGLGWAFTSHIPTMAFVSLGSLDLHLSLIDTGVTLSIINKKLAQDLHLLPLQGPSIQVNGVRHDHLLGFAMLAFSIQGRRQNDPVLLRSSADFHMLSNFSPGILLGLDVIHSTSMVIDICSGRVQVQDASSPIYNTRGKTMSAKNDVQYTVDSSLWTSSNDTGPLAVPSAILNHNNTGLWVTNFGPTSIDIQSDTRLAEATPLAPDDIAVLAGSFCLNKATANPIKVVKKDSFVSDAVSTDEAALKPFKNSTNLSPSYPSVKTNETQPVAEPQLNIINPQQC